MATIDATGLLRPELLSGVSVLVAGPAEAGAASAPGLAGAVGEACAALGAEVRWCEPHASDEALVDEAVRVAVADTGGIELLVLDGAALFTAASALADDDPEAASQAGVHAGAHEALRACLDSAWNVTRAVINHAFLRGEGGGRIVYLAPAPDAGEFAEAARAGLENLSRTLSIEWARHGVSLVCIAPGASTAAGEVAALCAYLASPAGAYFSGCLLDLRGV